MSVLHVGDTAPTPTTAYLASLAAALETADSSTLGNLFAEMADEALAHCEKATTPDLLQFWLDLHESFDYEAQRRLNQPKPKRRRWFR